MEDKGIQTQIDRTNATLQTIIDNVEKVIVGKRNVIQYSLVALLCGGHVLLEDVPGVGKTMLIRAIAKSIGLDFKRIQFTPDLLPSDVSGVSIFNQKTLEFEFRQVQSWVMSYWRMKSTAHHQRPGCIARGDGRGQYDRRWGYLQAAKALFCARNTKPDRIRRHLPITRSAIGSLPNEAKHGISKNG